MFWIPILIVLFTNILLTKTVLLDKPWHNHISKQILYIYALKLNFSLCYLYGQSEYVWSSQTAYRCRFPIWLEKLVAGSAPCLHSNQWCWASVTAHVLFQNEYFNATGCSFSLDGNLALSPWEASVCLFHEGNGLRSNLESCSDVLRKWSLSVFDK